MSIHSYLKKYQTIFLGFIASLCILYLYYYFSSKIEPFEDLEKVSDVLHSNVNNPDVAKLPSSKDLDLDDGSMMEDSDKLKILYVKGEKGERGYIGPKGDPGSFAENSCKFFGSNDTDAWRCPDTHPIYSGASFTGNGLKCNGGIAKNSKCSNKGGSGALGVAVLDKNGGIIDVKMTETGSGYKVAPKVEFIGGGGFGAIAESIISNGKVLGVNIIQKGKFYKYAPSVAFVSKDNGEGAQAVAKVRDGRVAMVTITNSGTGYSIPPIVDIEGGGGIGAEAIAQLTDGHVTNILLVKNGSGYTYSPAIKIRPRVTEQGCQQCHLCCKRTPKNEKDRVLDKQVYNNATELAKQDEKLFKLQKQNDKLFNSMKRISRTLENMKYKPVVLDDNQIVQRAGTFIPPAIGSTPSSAPRSNIQAFEQTIKQEKDVSNILNQFPLDNEKQEPLSNWAINGRCKIIQSSTMRDAYKAIDGNKSTSSATNIEKNPFIEIEFIQAVEVNSIYLLFNKTMQPTMITLFNANNGKVFEQEVSGNVVEYKYDNVFKIGKKLRVQIKNAEDSIELKEVNVLGRSAKNCDYYVNKLFKIMERNKDLLLTRKITNNDKLEEKMFNQYYESCMLLDEAKEKERADIMEQEANEYNKILDNREKMLKEQAEYFRKELEQVKAEMAEDDKINEEAKSLGLKGIRPKYTQEYLDELKGKAEFKGLPRLEGAHGSFCYRLLNKSRNLRNKAENVTSQLENVPILQPVAEMSSRHSDNAQDMYKKYCENGEKPPSIITKNNFFGRIALDLAIYLGKRDDVYGADYSGSS